MGRMKMQGERLRKRELAGTVLLITGSVFAGLLLGGCASVRPVWDVHSLQQNLQQKLTAEEMAELTVPYEIDDEIRDYAHALVRHTGDSYQRAIMLVDAILQRDKLNISYTRVSNMPATEVFRSSNANCLSYTNLFIGMAREVNIHAVYVDVTEIEEIQEAGNIIVSNGHICAGIFHQNSFSLVDFSPNPRRRYVRYRVIDDREAIANYYNNLGYELAYHNRDGTNLSRDADLRYFELATRIKPDFAKAFNNLGVAHARRGSFAAAEKMYRRALALQHDFSEAYANLGNLYYKWGKLDKAVFNYRKAIRFASDRTYYEYQLGMVEFTRQNYPEAIRHFERVLHRKTDFPQALNGLGMVYFRQGDTDKAIENFRHAIEVDPGYAEAIRNLRLVQLAGTR